MMSVRAGALLACAAVSIAAVATTTATMLPHGTIVTPISRVYRIYQANPSNPSFPLAANAVAIDGELSYYTWNEVSRNIPQAVLAGLPPAFDYSPWIPDGAIASAGRTDPNSTEYPRTYAGLDQVSADWPTTPIAGGQTLAMSFYATAPHSPSVWDVWMTTPDWDPSTSLRWSHMEWLARPNVTFTGSHYNFDLDIPADRSGHHVLWVAWQRDDPVGEVFFSTSDVMVSPANDTCAGATEISLGRLTGNLELATPSNIQASCENVGSPDLWFRITAPCSGNLQVAPCIAGGAANASASIWNDACPSPTELACGNCAAPANSPVVAGTDYLIKVSAPPGANTTFDLHVHYANNTGSFTPTTPACSSANLQTTGSPNLGGYVRHELQSSSGLVQAIVLGFTSANAPICAGCTLGASIDVVVTAPIEVRIPCDGALVGMQWWAQGLDALGTGGCSLGGGIDYVLTGTVRTTIGS